MMGVNSTWNDGGLEPKLPEKFTKMFSSISSLAANNVTSSPAPSYTTCKCSGV